MNNFYAWLPGGYKREYYEDDENHARVIDAMDKLLAEEFTDLEVEKILHVMLKTYTTVMVTVREGRNEEEHLSLDEKLAIAHREEEKLRPLFNRLVELGFDPKLLRG